MSNADSNHLRHTYADELAARRMAVREAEQGLATPALPGHEASHAYYAELNLATARDSLAALEADPSAWEAQQAALEARLAEAFDLDALDVLLGGS